MGFLTHVFTFPQTPPCLKPGPSDAVRFFTATWPMSVRKLASEFLSGPYTVTIGNRDELKGNQDITQQIFPCNPSNKILGFSFVRRIYGLSFWFRHSLFGGYEPKHGGAFKGTPKWIATVLGVSSRIQSLRRAKRPRNIILMDLLRKAGVADRGNTAAKGLVAPARFSAELVAVCQCAR